MIKKEKYILGISAFYHDSAAVLLKDGEIISASQEERFTRKKHDESFPKNAIDFCLDYAGISMEDIDTVVFYEKPFLKFERILKSFLCTWPFGFLQFIKAVPIWLKNKLFIKTKIKKYLNIAEEKIFFSEHHISHAASSVYTSPFKESAILVIDGVGEFATTSIGIFKDGKIEMLKEIEYPDSLGLLYSTITGYLGFKVNSAEYKVMGLAPYGEPKYLDKMKKLIHIYEDGSFKLNMKYFKFEKGLRMYSRSLEKLFDEPARKQEGKLNKKHFDIASSLQAITEEIVLNLAIHTKEITNFDNLCISGGVALNCVANGKILKSQIFKNIYIQPASGDAGGALGAALYYWYKNEQIQWNPLNYFSPYLGPSFSEEKIHEFLESKKIKYKKFKNSEECCKEVAKLINGENVVGWFQNRSEFGPRALGNRSIIADARNKDNWKKVNLKVKFRESFRPFAPSVLEERIKDYFDLEKVSPYMLLTAPVKTKNIPAVTHVDNSARIQSVNKEQNLKYYELIKEFEKLTGCGVVINTSFNVRGEPMVNTPKEAFQAFVNTEMDYLVMENFLLDKKENLRFIDSELKEKYIGQFELD